MSHPPKTPKQIGPHTSHSVLYDWLCTIPYKQQAALLAMTRGCDGTPKEDISKYITRSLRGTFIRPAMRDPSSFHHPATEPNALAHAMDEFIESCDHYPLHFITHLMMASQVVGFKHPDPVTRKIWLRFYERLCRNIHVLPESESNMDIRLADEHGWTPHNPLRTEHHE